MSTNYSKLQEDFAWASVEEFAGRAGLYKALLIAHDRPMLAKQLTTRLHAIGFAVYRSQLSHHNVRALLAKSRLEAWEGRITSLEELMQTMSIQLHEREPKARSLPYEPRAQLPPGCDFFPADAHELWTAIETMVDFCAPCFCETNGDRRPRPHHHLASLKAA